MPVPFGEVFSVDGVRTPQGRDGGVLAGVGPDDLAAPGVLPGLAAIRDADDPDAR